MFDYIAPLNKHVLPNTPARAADFNAVSSKVDELVRNNNDISVATLQELQTAFPDLFAPTP